MSLLDAFCASHALNLRGTTDKLLLSEALYRGLNFKSSEVQRCDSIGEFNSSIEGCIVQALDTTSMLRILKARYSVYEREIESFTDSITITDVHDVLLMSYRLFSVDYPYKDYVDFIAGGLSDKALHDLGLEKKFDTSSVLHLLKSSLKEIYFEVTLAVNTFYAIEDVALELNISETEAKQKILYTVQSINPHSIFFEYYKNILGNVRSIPSGSASRVIRTVLGVKEGE